MLHDKTSTEHNKKKENLRHLHKSSTLLACAVAED